MRDAFDLTSKDGKRSERKPVQVVKRRRAFVSAVHVQDATPTTSQPARVASTSNAQLNADDVDARMAQIEQILGQAAMHLLEKCGLVAEWVSHAETKLCISGQPVRKTQRGRPEGGVARAARELRVPGKTPDARRKFIERAIKIDGIWPDAKSEARAVGLDDTQSALLAIASERSLEAQVEKVQELARRKALPRPTSSAAARSQAHGEKVFKQGASPSTALTSEGDIPPFLDRRPLSPEDQSAFDRIRAAWNSCTLPTLWKRASDVVQKRFIAVLQSAD